MLDLTDQLKERVLGKDRAQLRDNTEDALEDGLSLCFLSVAWTC